MINKGCQECTVNNSAGNHPRFRLRLEGDYQGGFTSLAMASSARPGIMSLPG